MDMVILTLLHVAALLVYFKNEGRTEVIGTHGDLYKVHGLDDGYLSRIYHGYRALEGYAGIGGAIVTAFLFGMIGGMAWYWLTLKYLLTLAGGIGIGLPLYRNCLGSKGMGKYGAVKLLSNLQLTAIGCVCVAVSFII